MERKFKWDEEEIIALVGSIAKWRKILHAGAKDEGGKTCTLCKRFTNCAYCPVAVYVQNDSCNGTPYTKWVTHSEYYHDSSFVVECGVCEYWAQKELDFLHEVLEAGL